MGANVAFTKDLLRDVGVLDSSTELFPRRCWKEMRHLLLWRKADTDNREVLKAVVEFMVHDEWCFDF